MESCITGIVHGLVENGNIRAEDEEVYQYALKSVIILGTNIILSMVIGVLLGMPICCALFMGAFIPLRSDAGGYLA